MEAGEGNEIKFYEFRYLYALFSMFKQTDMNSKTNCKLYIKRQFNYCHIKECH